MSDWKLIEPQETTNESHNPSVEVDLTGWTTGGTTAIARDSTVSRFGIYSIKMTYGNAINITFTPNDLLVPNSQYRISIWLYVTSGWTGTHQLGISLAGYGGSSQSPETTWAVGNITDGWMRIETQISVAADVTGTLVVTGLGAGTNPGAGEIIYVDGLQIEQQDESITTYCDGDQKGCSWNELRHSSSSTRSGTLRAGGIIRDLQDDLDFDIGTVSGAGFAPLQMIFDDYTLLPGGEINAAQEIIRRWKLGGIIENTTMETWHSSRQNLLKLLSPFTVPKNDGLVQPVTIRYTGAEVDKQIEAHYTRGLESSIKARDPCYWERVVLSFSSPNPFWYDIGDTSQILNTEGTATLRYTAGRLKEASQWDDLGLTANPAASGAILVVVIGPDKKVYMGGTFTGMDGVAGRDNIARYDPDSDTWETVGAGSAINAGINDMMFGPDNDTLYIVGAFTNVGDANGDYFAKYNISTDTWTSVSGGGIANGFAIDIGQDGVIYIGGNFTNWNAIASADGIVTWDGVAYAALSTGVSGGSGLVETIKVVDNGDIYVGGNFTTAGGNAAANVAVWNGTVFSALSTGTAGVGPSVFDIEQDAGGQIYVAGAFTTAGGVTVNGIAIWNGTTFLPLQDGTVTVAGIRTMRFAPDGLLWVVGNFATVGTLTDANLIAKWDGSSWRNADISFSTVTQVTAIDIPKSSVDNDYDVFIGFNVSGVETIAGSTIVTNSGTTKSFPQIVIQRTGGTLAVVKSLRNDTTGLDLTFDYSLLDGEIITLELGPQIKRITSSFFGDRPDIIQANSDWGAWELLPGNNTVTCFVDTSGGATVLAYVLYRTPYASYD